MASPVLLLVDDVPELCVLATALARRCGCEVVCRPDVPLAWDWLQDGRPDLVLLDKNLPGESGLGLCRRLRGTPPLAHLPVALFCHWGMTADVAEGLEAGIDFVFAKDLVTQGEAWRRRLGEILAVTHGQSARHSLGWRDSGPTPPEVLTLRPVVDWFDRVGEALRHRSLRPVGPAATRTLLRRALVRGFAGHAAPAEVQQWLLPGEAGLDTRRMLPRPPAEAVVRSVMALADQVWCMLGTEASLPCWAALDLAIPGLSEVLASR